MPWRAGAWPQKLLGSEGPLDEKQQTWVKDGVLVPPFIYQMPNLEKSNPPVFLIINNIAII